jgi:predicted transcriptional regulator
MPNNAFYQQQYQPQYQGQYPGQYQAPQQYWQPQQQPWQPQQQVWQQSQPYGAPNPWNQQMPAQTWEQQMAPQPWQQGVPMQAPPQANLSQQIPTQFATGSPEGTPAAMPKLDLNDRELLVIEYLRTHESVGPRDLVLAYQLSESTWSRVLSQLEARGLLSKQGGQKRFLTPQGKQLLGF